MSKRILIIDDEPDLIELVSYSLQQEGYEVLSECDGQSGLERARQQLPQLIILDLMLPGLDGLEVCRCIRHDALIKSIPVIMLTAKGSETDRVVGLEIGADDYVTKPFSARELVARVRALLRRSPRQDESPPVIQHGLLQIDGSRYQASYRDSALGLTVAEFEILRFLAEHPDKVFTRQEVIDGALGKEVVVTDRNVDVHVGAIRKKLGEGRQHIKTVRGVGYYFTPAPGSND